MRTIPSMLLLSSCKAIIGFEPRLLLMAAYYPLILMTWIISIFPSFQNVRPHSSHSLSQIQTWCKQPFLIKISKIFVQKRINVISNYTNRPIRTVQDSNLYFYSLFSLLTQRIRTSSHLWLRGTYYPRCRWDQAARVVATVLFILSLSAP